MRIFDFFKVNGEEAQLDYEKGLANKPSIPTKTSQLTNDSGFITKEDIPEGEAIDLSGYALKEDVPTKVSQLTNDSGFMTDEELNAAAGNFVTKTEFEEARTEINAAFTQVYSAMNNFVTQAQVLALIDSAIVTALNSEV